jgi:tRNA-specific 2-thiouridylase
LFVVAIDAPHRRVIVGPRASLRATSISLHDVNWLADPAEAAECSVKVRSMRAPVSARVAASANGAAVVQLAEPEEAVAPGQACVFYKGSQVLGGGWITRDKPLLDSP